MKRHTNVAEKKRKYIILNIYEKSITALKSIIRKSVIDNNCLTVIFHILFQYALKNRTFFLVTLFILVINFENKISKHKLK